MYSSHPPPPLPPCFPNILFFIFVVNNKNSSYNAGPNSKKLALVLIVHVVHQSREFSEFNLAVDGLVSEIINSLLLWLFSCLWCLPQLLHIRLPLYLHKCTLEDATDTVIVQLQLLAHTS